MIEIRKAQPTDLKAVQKLNQQLFQYELSEVENDNWNFDWPYSEDGEKYFVDTIAEKRGVCFVATDADILVGYLAGGIQKVPSYRPIVRAEVENMFIAEQYRRASLGKTLMHKFVEWATAKGASKILAEHFAVNPEAGKFYKACGFKPFASHLELDIPA